MEWASEYGALGFLATLEKHSQTLASTAAGVIQQPTCSTAFPSQIRQKPRPCCTIFGVLRPRKKPRKRSICSSKPLKIKHKSDGLFAKTPNRIARLLRRFSSSLAEHPNNKFDRVHFATIRHRTKRSKCCLRRMGMLQMMFKRGQ